MEEKARISNKLKEIRDTQKVKLYLNEKCEDN